MRTLISCVKQNATPNLKEAKAETRVALPSLMTSGTHPMLTLREVNGAATDASAVDREMPKYFFEVNDKYLLSFIEN